MNEYEDDFIAEELPEKDEETLFAEASITTKSELLAELKYRKRELQKNAGTDVKHSAAYYHALLSLLDRFIKTVNHTVFFEKLEPFWAYSYEISSEGIVLLLSHNSSVYFNEDNTISFEICDQEFELIRTECKMLTIDEYAKLYGIENVTVRQWIRRGKIRTAKKYGSEWRIPELTEFPLRGYKFGQYKIGKEAVFPAEYAFISEYTLVSLEQDKTDKTKYHISFSNTEDKKSIICDTKEREKIEMLLIENPFVKYISDCYEHYS